MSAELESAKRLAALKSKIDAKTETPSDTLAAAVNNALAAIGKKALSVRTGTQMHYDYGKHISIDTGTELGADDVFVFLPYIDEGSSIDTLYAGSISVRLSETNQFYFSVEPTPDVTGYMLLRVEGTCVTYSGTEATVQSLGLYYGQMYQWILIQ